MDNIVYFELNNWAAEDYYPNAEPFLSWMGDDCSLIFLDEKFVEENRLCVVVSVINMSINFCITAKESWVKEKCPELLTKYRKFLREPEEDGKVYSDFTAVFLEYSTENIGIHYE